VERIDGDLLDEIGRLWYRGKGLPEPEQQALLATQVVIRGWREGEMLAYGDVLTGVRQDFYVFGDRLYEAEEMYCPLPGCACGEVTVAFETRVPRGAPPPGRVIVDGSGRGKLEPSKNGRDRLAQLWRAFLERHPRHVDRFARRYPVMKTIGERVVGEPGPAPGPTISRNGPCPCGSGKKYKRCCAPPSR